MWGGWGGCRWDFSVTPVPIGLGFRFRTFLGLGLGLRGLDFRLGLDNLSHCRHIVWGELVTWSPGPASVSCAPSAVTIKQWAEVSLRSGDPGLEVRYHTSDDTSGPV